MKFKQLRKNTQAITPVLSAVMLLGVILGSYALWINTSMPSIAAEQEYELALHQHAALYEWWVNEDDDYRLQMNTVSETIPVIQNTQSVLSFHVEYDYQVNATSPSATVIERNGELIDIDPTDPLTTTYTNVKRIDNWRIHWSTPNPVSELELIFDDGPNIVIATFYFSDTTASCTAGGIRLEIRENAVEQYDQNVHCTDITLSNFHIDPLNDAYPLKQIIAKLDDFTLTTSVSQGSGVQNINYLDNLDNNQYSGYVNNQVISETRNYKALGMTQHNNEYPELAYTVGLGVQRYTSENTYIIAPYQLKVTPSYNEITLIMRSITAPDIFDTQDRLNIIETSVRTNTKYIASDFNITVHDPYNVAFAQFSQVMVDANLQAANMEINNTAEPDATVLRLHNKVWHINIIEVESVWRQAR